MVTIEKHIGRLVEIRWRLPLTEEDAHHVKQKIEEHQREQTSKVVCIDARGIKLFPRAITEIMQDIIQRDAADLIRSAILLTKNNAIGSLQHTRLLYEMPLAKQKSRVCHDPEELISWLSEVLTPTERARLSLFLSAA